MTDQVFETERELMDAIFSMRDAAVAAGGRPTGYVLFMCYENYRLLTDAGLRELRDAGIMVERDALKEKRYPRITTTQRR